MVATSPFRRRVPNGSVPLSKARRYPFGDLLPYVTYHSKVFLFVFESISLTVGCFLSNGRDPPPFRG
jgi:hypothetical protein